jgi:NTE family protein
VDIEVRLIGKRTDARSRSHVDYAPVYAALKLRRVPLSTYQLGRKDSLIQPEYGILTCRNDPNELPLALTLSGGGARAAYQVGVLRSIARRHPKLRVPLLTGVSAGAINISHLASFEGDLADSADALTDLWLRLRLENVFCTGGPALLWRALKAGAQLSVGLPSFLEPVHGMVDTQPLRDYLHSALHTSDGSLPGIARNIASGRLRGVALTANCYATSDTVTFFSGQAIKEWERPYRRSVETQLTIEHIMASSALPFLFPPVRIGSAWYGDGGVRLNAPLAPAVHMGAGRLVVISTHYAGNHHTLAHSTAAPSPATVLSSMYNSAFLDQLDQDVRHMQRTNRLIHNVGIEQRDGLRQIGLFVIRPSRDLGSLAFDLKDRVPPTVRYLLRRLGSGQEESDDFLSTMMFHEHYVRQLIEIGEHDGEAAADEISEFLMSS